MCYFTTRLAHTDLDPEHNERLKIAMDAFVSTLDTNLSHKLPKLSTADLPECLGCLTTDTVQQLVNYLDEEYEILRQFYTMRQAHSETVACDTSSLVPSTGKARTQANRLLHKLSNVQCAIWSSEKHKLIAETKGALLLAQANGTLWHRAANISAHPQYLHMLRLSSLHNLVNHAGARLQACRQHLAARQALVGHVRVLAYRPNNDGPLNHHA